MNIHQLKQDPQDYAGKYLKFSEHYTFIERAMLPFETAYNIIVPQDAEEFGDLSFYQIDPNWDEYRTHARAAILRIGQGTWKDTKFERNYSEGKRVGCLIGGYWFYDGRYSPQQQAGIIIAAMQGKTFELELYMDWELDYGGAHEGLQNVVALMELLDKAGLKVKAIGMYSGYYFFIEHSNATKNASQYNYLKTRPFWIAWYAAASFVKVPAPWTDYTLWQWGTPAWDWGQQSSEIDMNKSRYTRLEFENEYINGGTIPGNGEPMTETHEGTIKQTLNVRSGPGTTYPQKLPPLGYLLAGDRVYGVLDVSTSWFHFGRIIRKDGTVEIFDAWASAASWNISNPPYMSVVSYTPPVEPDPPTLPATVESTDVWKDDAGVVIATYTGTLTRQ